MKHCRARRFGVSVLFVLLLTQSACTGDRVETKAPEIRELYATVASIEGSMTLRADYGDRVYDYALSFHESAEDGLRMTITEPAELGGVVCEVAQGETSLSFQGTRLETGKLSPDGLSPLAALPQTLSALREGYLAEMTREMLGEREALRLWYRDPGVEAGSGTEVLLWVSAQDFTLLQSELRQDGRTVIFVTYSALTMTGSDASTS